MKNFIPSMKEESTINKELFFSKKVGLRAPYFILLKNLRNKKK